MPNVNAVQPRLVEVFDYFEEGVTLSAEEHARVQKAPDPVVAFAAVVEARASAEDDAEAAEQDRSALAARVEELEAQVADLAPPEPAPADERPVSEPTNPDADGNQVADPRDPGAAQDDPDAGLHAEVQDERTESVASDEAAKEAAVEDVKSPEAPDTGSDVPVETEDEPPSPPASEQTDADGPAPDLQV